MNKIYPIEEERIQIYQQKENPDYTIIFLLGMFQYKDKVYKQFQEQKKEGCKIQKILFIQPPTRHVQLVNKQVPAWYDVTDQSPDLIERYGQDDVQQSYQEIIKIIQKECELYYNGDFKKIVLGGFSQGAFMAYQITFQSELNLLCTVATGGIINPKLQLELKECKKRVLAYCGDDDYKFPNDIFQKCFEQFEGKIDGLKVQLENGLKHSISENFVISALKFIDQNI